MGFNFMTENVFDTYYDQYMATRYTDPKAAKEALRAMGTEARKQNDAVCLGRVAFCRADYFYGAGKFGESILACEKSISLLQATPAQDTLPRAYNLLGILYGVRGNHMVAMEHLFTAEALALQHRKRFILCIVYNNLACSYRELGDYDSALKYLKRALRNMQKSTTRPVDYVSTYINILTIYALLGQFELARPYYDLCVELFRAHDLSRYSINLVCARNMLALGDGAPPSQADIDELLELSRFGRFSADNAIDLLAICEQWVALRYFAAFAQLLPVLVEKAKEPHMKEFQLRLSALCIGYHLALGQEEEARDEAMRYYRFAQEKEATYHALVLRNAETRIALNKVSRAHTAAQQQVRVLSERSERDSLTKLYNRTVLDSLLARRFLKAQQAGTRVCVAIIDVDYFKQYNDFYGHLKGDDCLAAIAGVFLNFRGPDTFFVRYGGDEFLAVNFGAQPSQLENLAQTIRMEIRNLRLTHEKTTLPEKRVTLSQGLFCAVPDKDEPFSAFIAAADAALYRAKERRDAIEMTVRD